MLLQVSPDTIDNVITDASKHSWESAIVAIIILGSVGLIAFIVKWQMRQAEKRETAEVKRNTEREERLSARITNLENFVEQKLITALDNSTNALNNTTKAIGDMTAVVKQLSEALNERPCFWDKVHQEELLEELLTKVMSRLLKTQEPKTTETKVIIPKAKTP